MAPIFHSVCSTLTAPAKMTDHLTAHQATQQRLLQLQLQEGAHHYQMPFALCSDYTSCDASENWYVHASSLEEEGQHVLNCFHDPILNILLLTISFAESCV